MRGFVYRLSPMILSAPKSRLFTRREPMPRVIVFLRDSLPLKCLMKCEMCGPRTHPTGMLHELLEFLQLASPLNPCPHRDWQLSPLSSKSNLENDCSLRSMVVHDFFICSFKYSNKHFLEQKCLSVLLVIFLLSLNLPLNFWRYTQFK